MVKITEKFTIGNELGFHARPAALFVKTANSFQSEILVKKGAEEVNGKSIINLLTLAAAKGDKILVTACGEDAAEAIKNLRKILIDIFKK
ncbi:MAG: HPr family phosphocarrier protein [Candidatus Omnitrophica bacterium]|nr:HPr family phosphocarrier protein [Candidatus Omnitrophota bacterium]